KRPRAGMTLHTACSTSTPPIGAQFASESRPTHGMVFVARAVPCAPLRPTTTETTIMSTPAEVRTARRVLRHELEAIRGNWGWILALGILLIIVGTIAVAMPFVASLASAVAFGALLLMGGIAQLIGAFWTRDWSGFFLSLLMGVLY